MCHWTRWPLLAGGNHLRPFQRSVYVLIVWTCLCYGLFQIHFQAHKSWLATIGVTNPSQLLDAGTNARAALTLYKRSNSWAAWE
jgi:hypothetical protein